MKFKEVIHCNEPRFYEFPEMLFGKSQEDDMTYFDATVVLEQRGIVDKESIRIFESKVEIFLVGITKSYGIPRDDLIVSNKKNRHILMEESLAIPFLAFLDPEFSTHILEKITEMLITGIVLSDTYIANTIKERFTKNDIDQLFSEK